VKRISINVAVHRDRLDAHLFARPNYATGNLAAVGDQDFFKLSRVESHSLVEFPTKGSVQRRTTGSLTWALDAMC